MSKKALTIVVLVVAAAAAVYLTGGMKNNDGDTDSTGSVGAPSSSGVVSYKCDQNKSFSLRYVDGDTVRLEGSGITNINLEKKITGYWISADGKTTVKTVGSYVVLVQKDLVTHDRCAVK